VAGAAVVGVAVDGALVVGVTLDGTSVVGVAVVGEAVDGALVVGPIEGDLVVAVAGQRSGSSSSPLLQSSSVSQRSAAARHWPSHSNSAGSQDSCVGAVVAGAAVGAVVAGAAVGDGVLSNSQSSSSNPPPQSCAMHIVPSLRCMLRIM